MDSKREIEEKILSAHASTRERLAYMPEFIETIRELTKGDSTIADIGAGVFPLALPIAEMNLTKYLAVENQQDSVDILKTFKKTLPEGVFEVFDGNVKDVVWSDYIGHGQFDIAIMLKLISVAVRRDKSVLYDLASVPARKFLVSVPKSSLTKNVDIRHKEIVKVKEFAKEAGKEIKEKYDFPDEILYVLE